MIAFYRAIWRHTWRRQLVLVALSLAAAALAAAPLEYQQRIINHLVARGELERLIWLCAGFLAVVAASGAVKFALNYQVSAVGERVIRRIRALLYEHYIAEAVRLGVPSERRGTLVATLSAEAEGVGAFAGSAIATPVMQIGTLVSVVGFITANEPLLGVIALAVLIPQVAIVLWTQPRINRRVRTRTYTLRDASDRISVSDMQAKDPTVVADFDHILDVRLAIFRLKLSTKFVQNLISAGGTAGVLLLGGWFVLTGRTDAGTVVASLTGLTRLEGPWRELIAFYRQASTMRVSFELIVDQFVAGDAPRRR